VPWSAPVERPSGRVSSYTGHILGNLKPKLLRKSGSLGSVNAMNFWRPSQSFVCFLCGWMAKGASSKGSVENFPGRRRLLFYP